MFFRRHTQLTTKTATKQAPKSRYAAETLHQHPEGFHYRLRLSDRKTTSLKVSKGEVLVSAPRESNLTELEQWVSDKSDWIGRQLRKQAQRQQEIPKRVFTEGAQLPFLGRQVTIRLAHPQPKAAIKLQAPSGEESLQDQLLIVTTSTRSTKSIAEQAELLVKDWYKLQAQVLLLHKTQQQAKRLQRKVSDVRLRLTKSKWGHCTSTGVIQYNWHIVLAPEPIVDYLVVHECCHLVHHNHSPAFWQLVQQHCSHAQASRRWLRDNGHRLIL